jgi:hypothetical protein
VKEKVIIGRLIPAGTGLPAYRSLELATPDGVPLIVEPSRSEERTLPLVEDEVDDIPLLGRTAGRPDRLPIDVHEMQDMATEPADNNGIADEGDDLMARLLATMGSDTEEEIE